MTTTTPSQLERLRSAGRKYARANAARKAALAELLDAIRETDRTGDYARAEIVAAAGVAKQTVYNVLDSK